MTNLICIVCPRGCHLTIDESTKEVKGNACERGKDYAVAELTAPVRMLTSTVCIKGAEHRRCPVKTNRAIPKSLVMQAVKALDGLCITSPVKIGDIVIKNVCNTGADIVATRDI